MTKVIPNSRNQISSHGKYLNLALSILFIKTIKVFIDLQNQKFSV